MSNTPNPVRVLSFGDLQKAGIVRDWSGLRRLIDHQNFHPGILLSPGKRVWPEAAVTEWLASRPHYDKPSILRGAAKANAERAQRRRGRA